MDTINSTGVGLTGLLSVSAILLLLLYFVWHYTYFMRRGIPGPIPLPIFGNTLEWRNGVHIALDGYIKKYGNCCGFYQLFKPTILVSDPVMVKQILVKHFDRFHNRMYLPADNPSINKALFLSRDQQWKKIRNTLTPAFSGRKMKLMSQMITKSTDRLVGNFRAACENGTNGVFECRKLFGAFIMDTIALCAFGLVVDSQNDKEDPFVRNAKRFFASVDFASPAMIITTIIPGSGRFLKLFGLEVFPDEVIKFFRDIVDRAIDMRKTAKAGKSVDFLQLIINAAEDDGDEGEYDEYSIDNGLTTPVEESKIKREPLTRQEVMGQALAFFVAGYETTTTGLSFAFYLLAMHPEQQDRLIDEIDRLAPTADDLNYDNLKRLTFLDCVINETLRLYPPGVLLDRVCNETTTINGHLFRAGDGVYIPVWTIQRDPNNWSDPLKFDPDRFKKENQSKHNPFAWLPFGSGPRFCVGLRFAMMEIRVALVRILQEFRLEVAPETEIPPTLGKMGFLTPPNGITLRAVERNK